jgi:aspartyl-tRNA(Asn)/glutamyl-tRNA(Gln) amidotransferase subunit A
LARYDGVKYGLRVESSDLIENYRASRAQGFGDEVKRRIMLGTYALSAGYYDAYYRRAQRVRNLIASDFRNAFESVDVIVAPTTPTPAFGLGEKIGDPLQMYLNDILTIPCNLVGLPGISLPCGFTRDGLPIGLQMLGRPFAEEIVLRAAYAYEQAAGHPNCAPEL